MDVLLRAHPLFGELGRLDDDAQVLALRTGDDLPRTTHARILAEERGMREQLDDAMRHARLELADLHGEYVRRENAAVARIFSLKGAHGPSAEDVQREIAAVSREQAASVDQQARRSFQVYRSQVIAQSEAALATLRQSFLDRADRAYRARAERSVQEEAAFTLDQAHRDASERLVLRARLANLALGPAARAEVEARLKEMDRKEADGLAALRNRDQAALAEYRASLRDEVRMQIAQEARAIQERTNARLSEQARQVGTQLIGQLGEVPAPVPLPAPLSTSASLPSGALSSDARARLETLHRQYQASYDEDARRILGQFAETRDALSSRFEQLAAVDAEAQASARREIQALRKQHDDLYGQMLAQIDQEVRAVAARRGVRLVIGKVVGPAGGIDLTEEALRDVERLHE